MKQLKLSTAIAYFSIASFILIISTGNYGCGDPYPKEKVPLIVTSEPNNEFLYQLRKRAFMQVSDSFNKYGNAWLVALIERKNDSAMYYKGKSDAYYSCENIIWPR